MLRLTACPSCGGLVPPAVRLCPHCDAGVPRAVPSGRRRAPMLRRAALAGFSLTLMACYGGGPMDGTVQDAFCAPAPARQCEGDHCLPEAADDGVPDCPTDAAPSSMPGDAAP